MPPSTTITTPIKASGRARHPERAGKTRASRRDLINLVGRRFGRLMVTAYAGNSYWSCLCDCGKGTVACGHDLRRGLQKGCGCLRQKINLTGKRFDRLHVVAYAGNDGDRASTWLCLCDCGERVVVSGKSLRRGRTRSCGCLHRERITKHGKAGNREYKIWVSMRHHHGDAVCDRWRLSPTNFLADMGPCPENYVLRRIDPNGKFERGNCAWVPVAKRTRHGMSKTREYRIWAGMKQRCLNPRSQRFEDYGGRGIGICPDWHEFVNHFADMGTCPPDCSLDRIDPNGDYEPTNCRWADARQQRRNQRPPRRTSAVANRRRLEQVEPPPLDDPPF